MQFNDIKSLCGMQKETLWAGQHLDAGHVIVSNDGSNLNVTVYSKYGFGPGDNVYIWITDEPLTSKPNPGQNPDGLKVQTHFEGGAKTEVTFQFSYESLGITPSDGCTPHQFFVTVHANVISTSGGTSETAFAGPEGEIHWGKGWFYYIDYSTVCCGACYCSFGYNYQNEAAGEEACIYTGDKFPGVTPFRLWSNRFTFSDLYGELIDSYELLLVADSGTCTPLDTNGDVDSAGGEDSAVKVGRVVITGKMVDGKRVVDVEYFMNSEFNEAPVQLDLYVGSKKVPDFVFSESEMLIYESTGDDHSSEVYQAVLYKGVNHYKFENLPWPVDDDGTEVFITPHAAVGTCPTMPSMGGNEASNDDM